MTGGAIKSGAILALGVAMTVCGANEGSSTTFQIDHVAFEQIYHPTAQQASRSWMTWLSERPAGETAEQDSPYISGLPPSYGMDAWRSADPVPIWAHRSYLVKSGANDPLIRLRPSTNSTIVDKRPIDTKIFMATPGGRPISNTYDFAGLDPDAFAAINPAKPKIPPVEKVITPKSKLAPSANEVLDFGVNTLSNIVLTAKLFFENISQTLYNPQ